DSFVWALGNLIRGSAHVICWQGHNDERQRQARCHLKRLLTVIGPLTRLYKDITKQLDLNGDTDETDNRDKAKDNQAEACYYSILVEITHVLWFVSGYENHSASPSSTVTNNNIDNCCCNDEDVIQLIVDANILPGIFQHLAKGKLCPVALMSASIRLFGQISAGFFFFF
ncbi:hypothetical protein RFI_14734, partial [Reticulomyxa filosa]